MGMTQENPKKMPVRNLERISEQKCRSYEEAAHYRQVGAPKGVITLPGNTYAKVKIFARNDNTFDVVWYKKIEEPKALKIDTGSIPPGEVDKLVKNVKKEFNKRVKNGKKQHA
jgi:hypothetical protein